MAMRVYELSRDLLILWTTLVHLFAHVDIARAFQALQTRMLHVWIIILANPANPIWSILHFSFSIISD
jgi:hypothetical protein